MRDIHFPDNHVIPRAVCLLIYDLTHVFFCSPNKTHKHTACQQIGGGVVAIIGPTDPILGSHVQSICDALDIPHIDFRISHSDSILSSSSPSSPSASYVSPDTTSSISSHSSHNNNNNHNLGMMIDSGDPSLASSLPAAPLPAAVSPPVHIMNPYVHASSDMTTGKEFSINLHPTASAFSQSLRHLVMYLNWTDVAVIYEQDVSLIALQDLIKPPTLPKNVQFIFRKSDPHFFRDTLLDVKARNIYSMIIDVKSDSIPAFLTAVC